MELLAPIVTKLYVNGAVSKLPILKSAKFQESQHFAQILGLQVLLNIKIESVPYVDCFKTIKAQSPSALYIFLKIINIF